MDEGKPGTSPADSSSVTSHLSSLHILVAEDNEFNAQLLEQLLGRRGHRVQLANNGREALRLAEKGAFDLLLLDVHMPELDGFQVAEGIREHERTAGGHLPEARNAARAIVEAAGSRQVALIAYAQVKNMNMNVVGVPGSNLPPHGGLATADIANATPKEFDRVFMGRLVADQQGFVAQAEAAGRIARDPALRALIAMTLPSMREQVAIAEALTRHLPAVPPAPRVPVPPPAPPP